MTKNNCKIVLIYRWFKFVKIYTITQISIHNQSHEKLGT